MEELLGRPLLALEHMDVVEQEHIHIAPVAGAEGLHRIACDRRDQLVQEGLGMHIPDPRLGVVDGDGGADRLHEVGLAEANAPEEDEGVVVGAGRLGDGPRRLPGKLVGASDHEVGKVEPAR